VSGKVGPARWARPTISVVHDSEKLAKLFQVALLPPWPKPPHIDFSRNDAVVITVGPRSSTGYSLHVVRVTQSGNLDILVRERTPQLGEKVEPVITYPYLLLVVPKLDKHVSVHYDGRY
jgi:PrcB C-terminal